MSYRSRFWVFFLLPIVALFWALMLWVIVWIMIPLPVKKHPKVKPPKPARHPVGMP